MSKQVNLEHEILNESWCKVCSICKTDITVLTIMNSDRCWLKYMQWSNKLEEVLLLGCIIVSLTLSLLMFTSIVHYNGRY